MTASENNWEPLDIRPGDPRLQWFDVPGADVQLQLNTERDAHKVMLAVAADFNAFVEKLSNDTSAAYTDGNSVFTSNHKNATAMDLNWDRHEFHVVGTFTNVQMKVIRAILDFFEGFIFWAGDWNDPVDEMHWQIGYDAWDDPDGMADFIKRKVRPDGFSTFQRGAAPAVPTGVAVLHRATGLPEAKCAEILPTLTGGLKLAQCNNPNRIANFIGQTRHESDNYNTTTEYASGAEYEGRSDLGNTQPGDGVKFKGRTWIQITGRSHYDQFSKWAWGNGLVTNPQQFVDNPSSLGLIQWAGIGAAWYWVVQRPGINAMCDDGDILGVTKAINGGTNGLAERTAYTNQALAVGNDLLLLVAPATGEDDDPMASDEALQMLRDIHRETVEQKGPSRSFMAIDGNDIDTPLGVDWNTDGNAWNLVVTFGYLVDEPFAVEAVEYIAEHGVYDGTYAGENEWLSKLGQDYCKGLVQFKNKITSALFAMAKADDAAKKAAEPPKKVGRPKKSPPPE